MQEILLLSGKSCAFSQVCKQQCRSLVNTRLFNNQPGYPLLAEIFHPAMFRLYYLFKII